MDSLIQQLMDSPILLAVALILVAIVVYALVKRLVKLALFLLVLLALYIGYLAMTKQELPEGVQKGKALLEEVVGEVTDKTGKFLDEHKGDIDKIKEKLTTNTQSPCQNSHNSLHDIHPGSHQIEEIFSADSQ